MANILRVTFLIITSMFASLAMAQTIYTTHGDGSRFGTIDALTGVGTDVGATGQSQGWALARDRDGTLYTTYDGFSGNAQLATIDPATGVINAPIGGLGVSLIALEVDSTGQLWGVGYDNGTLYRIDKTNAATTAVGDTGVTLTMDLSIDPSGNLYSTTDNVIYQLDPLTGASLGTLNITGTTGSVMGIMHDASGMLYATDYIAGAQLYSVDLSTGAATVVGSTGFDFPHGGDIENFGSVLTPTVPVPTLSAYGLGLTILCLLFLGSRRLRASTRRV
jgi:hypothetical protein